MRITVTHCDPAADSVLVVEDRDGNAIEVPPGKARTIDATPPFTVREAGPFPGWDLWNAQRSAPVPEVNEDLPVLTGRNN